MLGQLNDLVTLIGTGVFFVAWFIRLESKVNYLEKDHQRHTELQLQKDTALWAKVDTLQTSLNSLLQAVSRIEGKLENKE